MKPIIKKEQQDTILTSEITTKHIVVAIVENHPCILTKDYENDITKLSFKCLDANFMTGNSYSYDYKSIKDKVDRCLNMGNKVEVFAQSDWKLALQWLIDNA